MIAQRSRWCKNLCHLIFSEGVIAGAPISFHHCESANHTLYKEGDKAWLFFFILWRCFLNVCLVISSILQISCLSNPLPKSVTICFSLLVRYTWERYKMASALLKKSMSTIWYYNAYFGESRKKWQFWVRMTFFVRRLRIDDKCSFLLIFLSTFRRLTGDRKWHIQD